MSSPTAASTKVACSPIRSKLYKQGDGVPDGLKVDVHGNVFATGPGGVLVYAPDGTLLGRILTGVPTANVAFGEDGATLFITANHRVLRMRTMTSGMPLPVGKVERFHSRRGSHEFSPTSDRLADLRPGSRCALNATAVAADKARILVYSGSTGFRHDSIPAAVEALKSIGAKAGYDVDTSEDPEVFTARESRGLQGHRARQQFHRSEEARIRVVHRCDARCAAGLPQGGQRRRGPACRGRFALPLAWYGQMIGGYFERHPKGTPKATQHRRRRQTSGHRQTTQDHHAQRRVVLLQGLRPDDARADHGRSGNHRRQARPT